MTEAHPPVPIGMFVGTYLPFSETFIYDQLQRQERVRALVCAYEADPRASARFPYPHLAVLGPAARYVYQVLGVAPELDVRLRNHGARLIHAHFGTNGALALPFAERLGVPLVVTFHGHDVSGLLPRNRFTFRYGRYQAFARPMLDRAALLLCASQELADILVRDLHADPARIRVHRLGVDLTRFTPVVRETGPLRALMVGRFVEKKGFGYALRAFALVHRELPAATARIIGDGPLGADLRRLVRDLGLAEAVTFLGSVDSDGVLAEMRRATVLLAPSVVARNLDRESGVIVIKEAAACGLPTLGTWHGGIPEIIDDGRTGYLVPERDVELLAARLRDLASDPALGRELGAAARRKMEREYDTVQQNRRFEEHLLSVI
jgi:glycosyltransferase involved in cell wall biosynthesis